jgi:uncharacterized protein
LKSKNKDVSILKKVNGVNQLILNISLFAITLLAYFIKGITGFGNTLVMNSLFSFFKENRFTTPVDLLLSIPTNLYTAWKERKSINFKIVLPLTIIVILGNIPGILLLAIGETTVLKSVLGVVLILLGLEMYFRKSPSENSPRNKPIPFLIIGTLSGLLMGLFGIGALLAAYIHRTSKNRNDYRGNICCVFAVDNIVRLLGYLYIGILNDGILLFSLFMVPAIIAGMYLSTKVDRRFNEASVKKLILVLLILSGLVLFLKSILSLSPFGALIKYIK